MSTIHHSVYSHTGRHCTQQSCTSSVRRVHCARQKAHIIATCTLILRENRSSKGNVEKNAKGWQGQGRAGTANLRFRMERGMEAPNASEGASIDG